MAKKEKKDIAKKAVERTFEGEVLSDKMQKTIVVKVTRRFRHPLLGKTVQKTKNYKVHDEKEEANVGDLVEIVECRPLSKTKHMMLGRIIKAAS